MAAPAKKREIESKSKDDDMNSGDSGSSDENEEIVNDEEVWRNFNQYFIVFLNEIFDLT